MNRRKFAQAAAAVLIGTGPVTERQPAKAASTVAPMVTLNARFAAQMPARLTVPVAVLRTGAQIYERRVYSRPVPLDVFTRNGIKPVLVDGTSYLFPFASLEARQKAWDRLNADEGWRLFSAQTKLDEISLYYIESKN